MIDLVEHSRSAREHFSFCDPQMKEWLTLHAKEEWVHVDIGASIGDKTVLMSKISSKGLVYAYESSKDNLFLRKNLEHNKVANCTIIEPRTEDDHTNDRFNSFKLDEFVKEHDLRTLDCVRIDLLSESFQALNEAKNTLWKYNPWLILKLPRSADKEQTQINQILKWLSSQGYSEALVCDDQNYIFKRLDDNVTNGSITLHLNSRHPQFDTNFKLGAIVKNIKLRKIVSHNNTKIEFLTKGLNFTTPDRIWSQCISIELNHHSKTHLGVFVKGEVLTGRLGLGVQGAHDEYIYPERFFDVGEFTFSTFIFPGSKKLMMRSTSKDNIRVYVEAIQLRNTDKFEVNEGELPGARKKIINLHDHTDGKDPNKPSITQTIHKWALELLSEDMGWKKNYAPLKNMGTREVDWKMETNDAAILSKIYQNFRPKLHLEIGTWEGFGALLCAQNCNAKIFTVNLPHGEFDEKLGSFSYTKWFEEWQSIPEDAVPIKSENGRKLFQTDSKEFIGWLYKNTAFESRITQLFEDTRTWSASEFKENSFDTILIDGGHSEETVKCDTELAAKLLKPGGMAIWHDFSLEPVSLLYFETCRGVANGLAEAHEILNENFSKLIWIENSFLLVGIKKHKSQSQQIGKHFN